MKPSKANRSNRNRKAIVGVRKQYATTPTIILDGVSFTPATIAERLQASIDAADRTSAAEAVFHKAVAAEQAANVEADIVYQGLKTFVTGQFKTSPETLADFGFALPSRRAPDAATVAGATEKRKATRAARHTMGKRQKANVKGTGASSTPATATAATASSVPVVPAK